MTVEPIIVFNILITLIALWVAMAVNAKFLQPALLNKKRFAIYELRDRLALLAMRGVVDEMSEEYKTLITHRKPHPIHIPRGPHRINPQCLLPSLQVNSRTQGYPVLPAAGVGH